MENAKGKVISLADKKVELNYAENEAIVRDAITHGVLIDAIVNLEELPELILIDDEQTLINKIVSICQSQTAEPPRAKDEKIAMDMAVNISEKLVRYFAHQCELASTCLFEDGEKVACSTN